MADINKTVSIIFGAETSDAEQKIRSVEKSIDDLEKTAGSTNVEGTGKAIEKLGESSKATDVEARKLGDGLKKLASDAGAPKEALEGIDKMLLRIGGPVTGSAVLGAAAIAAFALAGINAGSDADTFRTKVENLTGKASEADDAFNFVRKAVGDLEIALGDGLDLYSQYLGKLAGTKLDAKTAEDAFIGIVDAVKGQGGAFKDSEKLLADFLEAAGDGSINIKDLDDKIRGIPGGLRIFAEALDVPIEDLYKLAENGKLGKEEISLFAEALRNEDFGSVTPVKDAFNDLWNTIKNVTLDMGAEGGFAAVMWVVEEAIRAVTLAVTGGAGLIEYFGKTLGNIAFTISTLDFTGFGARQDELWKNLGDGIDSAKNKFLGLKDVASGETARDGAKNYKDLADSLKAAGDEAEPAGKKTKDLAGANKEADKQTRELAKAAADTEKAIAKQAEVTRKAEEDVRRYALELEKLASNERIKFIEATVELNVAQVEADTKRIEKAFDSINGTINSTGDVLKEIFGLFKDPISEFDPRFDIINDQIERENKLREKAFDLQSRLTNAQIEQMRAQTSALANGDGFIKIDGAGLQPHLEAFMWEILNTIQVRVNAQGLSMLLGV